MANIYALHPGRAHFTKLAFVVAGEIDLRAKRQHQPMSSYRRYTPASLSLHRAGVELMNPIGPRRVNPDFDGLVSVRCTGRPSVKS
jgi:hypothetical protein